MKKWGTLTKMKRMVFKLASFYRLVFTWNEDHAVEKWRKKHMYGKLWILFLVCLCQIQPGKTGFLLISRSTIQEPTFQPLPAKPSRHLPAVVTDASEKQKPGCNNHVLSLLDFLQDMEMQYTRDQDQETPKSAMFVKKMQHFLDLYSWVHLCQLT